MRVFVLTGPTGVGKTEIAVMLAERCDLDLISADSRQVYCWLDIGTDKPPRAVRQHVRFHMVDTVEPDRRYSAADYARDALAAMRRLREEGRRFIVVGGGGLYIRAIFEPFFDTPRSDPELRRELAAMSSSELYTMLGRVDPDRAARLHPNDRQRIIRALEVFKATGRPMSELMQETVSWRPEFEPVYLVLNMERGRLQQRINERFDRMMRSGLLEEVSMLREHGFGRESYVANTYGYAELLAHIEGRISLATAVEEAKTKSRAYARRQLTWCRKLDDARWLEYTTADEAVEQLQPILTAVLTDEG